MAWVVRLLAFAVVPRTRIEEAFAQLPCLGAISVGLREASSAAPNGFRFQSCPFGSGWGTWVPALAYFDSLRGGG